MATKTHTYTEAVGRRKTAIARVRLHKSKQTSFEINGKALDAHFPTDAQRHVVRAALERLEQSESFQVTARVRGGGIEAQAKALRHGIARALVVHNTELRSPLKHMGFLKRDPRTKERRKFGLKKARRAPQWSKR